VDFAAYRGNLGVADIDSVLTGIESLRFFSTNPNATLVLFDRSRFRDNFVILRGNRSIRELDDFLRRGDVESLISSNQRLTPAQRQLTFRISFNLTYGGHP
jgi:hypothetical protein